VLAQILQRATKVGTRALSRSKVDCAAHPACQLENSLAVNPNVAALYVDEHRHAELRPRDSIELRATELRV